MVSIGRLLPGHVVFAIGLAGSAQVAHAVPIVTGSTLNFAGQSNCNATGCTYGSAIVTSGTGSFSSFGFGTAATFFPVTYTPFTPQQVYTTTSSGGLTASFVTTSRLDWSSQTVGGLTNYTMTDAGFARLTGFDDTAGTFLITANQNGSVQGSFSATAAVIAAAAPEPAGWALMILGFGVVGGTLRRRRHTLRVSYAA